MTKRDGFFTLSVEVRDDQAELLRLVAFESGVSQATITQHAIQAFLGAERREAIARVKAAGLRMRRRA